MRWKMPNMSNVEPISGESLVEEFEKRKKRVWEAYSEASRELVRCIDFVESSIDGVALSMYPDDSEARLDSISIWSEKLKTIRNDYKYADDDYSSENWAMSELDDMIMFDMSE